MKKVMIAFLVKYRYWFLLSLFALLAWGAITANLIIENNKKDALYLKTERELFKSEIRTILKTYEYFSNYIYQQVVMRPDVLQIMDKAAAGTDEERNAGREALYRTLEEDYVLMQKYSFRQLHFHLPNGDSFLRFHSPGQYGDNLTDVREAIRIVNTEKRYVFGFEEGRVFNGYRFVYPIPKDGRHLGSVEVSVSMATLFDVLYDLYPDIDLFFFIDKAVVEEIVFSKNLGNYAPSFISESFLNDKAIAAKFLKSNLGLNSGKLSRLRELVKIKSQKLLTGREDFSFILEMDRNCYLIQYIAVKNISGSFVGYCMAVKKNDAYHQIFSNLYRDLLLIAVIFVLFFILTFIYAKNKFRLEHLSSTDKLTSIFNRHYFLTQAEKEFERGKRYGNPISLLMFDIDHFKGINDQFGHDTGDEVLKGLAELIGSQIRKQDLFARWGGEEFLILMPETDLAGAMIAAEKLRALVEKSTVCKRRQVTVSIGVAEKGSLEENTDQLIIRADAALYKAKHEGRNRVCIGEAPS